MIIFANINFLLRIIYDYLMKNYVTKFVTETVQSINETIKDVQLKN
jgi:hypothetical protein